MTSTTSEASDSEDTDKYALTSEEEEEIVLLPSESQYATEIVRSLFGPKFGKVVGDYSCYHLHHSGRLYAGHNGVCFYSNLFGFERKVGLKWSEVPKLYKVRSTSIGIIDADSEEHLFRSFTNRDYVYKVLFTLCFRNRNAAGKHRSSSLSRVNGNSKRKVTRKSESAAEIYSKPSSFYFGERGADQKDVKDPLPTSDVPEQDLEKAWNDLKESAKARFNEVALSNRSIACDLTTFHDLFLKDDAPHSIGLFQQSKGDTQIETSPWKPCGNIETRTIKFQHSLNVPVGPSTTRGTKTQKLERFDERGISLETSTVLDDIHNADCFYVEELWLLYPSGDNSLQMEVRFQVRFIKSTMWKHVIENMTKKSTVKVYKDYVEMVSNALGVRVEREEVVEVHPPENLQEWVMHANHIPILLLGLFILVLLISMLVTLRRLSTSVNSLQEQMKLIQKDNLETVKQMDKIFSLLLDKKQCMGEV